jgi:type II secretory pathway component GspD/PulD (secretin)
MRACLGVTFSLSGSTLVGHGERDGRVRLRHGPEAERARGRSLLVRASPRDWEIVSQAIQALDLRPLQVLIEVVIAEVRRTSDLQLGVSALAENADDRGVDTRLELRPTSKPGLRPLSAGLSSPEQASRTS